RAAEVGYDSAVLPEWELADASVDLAPPSTQAPAAAVVEARSGPRAAREPSRARTRASAPLRVRGAREGVLAHAGRGLRPQRPGDRVAGARVDRDRGIRGAAQEELRVEGVVLQVDDLDRLELSAQGLDRGVGELVRERSLGLDAVHDALDLARLVVADHDREAARAVELRQEDVLAVRAVAEHDAREGDVDHLRGGHGSRCPGAKLAPLARTVHRATGPPAPALGQDHLLER